MAFNVRRFGIASTCRPTCCVLHWTFKAKEKMDQYQEFCRLRDYRKPGAEVPQYTEAEAFALATNKCQACSPAKKKAASNE